MKRQSDLVRGRELVWLQCGVLWQFVLVALGAGARISARALAKLTPLSDCSSQTRCS